MNWLTAMNRKQPLRKDGEDGTGQPPFFLELRCEEITPDGKFTPTALLALNSAWLETDWVRFVKSDDLVTLLLVMACVTPDGRFEATPERLAEALGQGIAATRQRLERLKSLHWRGAPLLEGATTPSGLERFWPNPSLLEVHQRTLGPPPSINQPLQPVQPAVLGSSGKVSQISDQTSPHTGPQDESPEPLQTQLSSPATAMSLLSSRREQVIAHSRAAYARPRALVEAEIADFLRPISPVKDTLRGASKGRQVSNFIARPTDNSGAETDTSGAGGQNDSGGKTGSEVKADEVKAGAEVNAEVCTNSDSVTGNDKPDEGVLHRRELIEPSMTPEVRAWHGLKRRLVGIGLPEEQASGLLETYSAERIERQLEWLPYRYARNPAYYLVAAIKADYAAPARIALQNLPPVGSTKADEGKENPSASPTAGEGISNQETAKGEDISRFNNHEPGKY